MDNLSTSISSHLVPEVRPDPKMAEYESKNLQSHCNVLDMSTLKSENMGLPVVKKLKIESDEKHTLEGPLYVSLPNDGKTETSEIVPGSNQIYPIKTEALVKIENHEAVLNESDKQIYEVNFEDWRIQNEKFDLKEENLESNELSYMQIFPNQTKPMIKIKKSNVAVNEPDEQTYNENFEYWRTKNEEFDLKEKDLESSEPSIMSSQSGSNFELIQNSQQSNLTSQIPNLREQSDHSNPEQDFKCNRCDFQTIYKHRLATHILWHKSPKEFNLFKCDQCKFQTLYKQSLNKHILRHKNPEEVNMLKCDQCDYQTVVKNYLQKHLRGHKNLEEVDTHKCEQYNFETSYKHYLKTHILCKKDSEEVNTMFKCDQCDYQTIQKGSLKRHLLRHKN